MESFWKALMNHQLLPKSMTDLLMKPKVLVEDDIFYGYGDYMEVNRHEPVKYIQMGYDPGVNYRSVYYPNRDLTIIVCSNKESDAYEMQHVIEQILLK